MTVAPTLAVPSPVVRTPLPRTMALAFRELRGGLRGFYVFTACVALGVTVIAGVGALGDALRAGFEKQGEAILGGDVTLTRSHRRADNAERAWLAGRGRLSETAAMRGMARPPDGSEQALMEIKGVDAAYPLAGEVVLRHGKSLDAALHAEKGAAVAPLLLEQLRLKVGDRLSVGQIEIPIAAVIESEPDTVTDRLTYGPRVLVSLDTLERTGLVQPGSLIRWRYALKLPPAANLGRFRGEVGANLPEAGFIVNDLRNPAPQVTRTLDRVRQFLTLLGLAALLVGGVGVANAVATFVDRRRKTIATLRSLGATGRTVLVLFLTQVMSIAALGVLIGLCLGYLVPVVLNGLYGSALPIRASLTINPFNVALAAAYGFLVALTFTLWPLGRAELIRPALLFRDEVTQPRVWPKPPVIVLTAAAALALAGLAVLTSDSRRIALYFCLGLGGVFAVFIGLGAAVTWGARRVRRPRRPELALAIGNLGAPGGLTRSVVLSLGSGLSLLVAVALADASFVRELTTRIPDHSPSYYVLDMQKSDLDAFVALVKREAPAAHINDAPMLRGRLLTLNGTPAEKIQAPPEAQWVLTGDRGLSFSAEVPEGSTVVEGTWWEADTPEPLVSFEVDLAKKLGLKIGDTLIVNILGRNVTARIANLREVKWESLAINFVMVFSPNTLKAAPYNLLATITLPKDVSLGTEAHLARTIGKAFPSLTVIRVKDALTAFNAVFEKIMTAVRVAGGVTLIAGALVLAGALATAQRRRIKQAVILKTLGATRRRILASHLVEYLLLAALTAFFAVAFGTLAAWVTLTQVMDLTFAFSWPAVLQTLGVSISLVALFGSFGTWQVLTARPVPHLRAE